MKKRAIITWLEKEFLSFFGDFLAA